MSHGSNATLLQEHKKWTENILVYEETLLDSLCFDLVVESPHACLATVFNSADLGTGQHGIFGTLDIPLPQDASSEEKQMPDTIVLNAWGVAHDTYVICFLLQNSHLLDISLRIPVCLFFNAKIIAASCFMISLVSSSNLSATSEWTDFPSPFDRYLSTDPSMHHWLEKFSLDVSNIQQISGKPCWLLSTDKLISSFPDCIFIMLYFYKTSEPNERIQSPIPFQQVLYLVYPCSRAL